MPSLTDCFITVERPACGTVATDWCYSHPVDAGWTVTLTGPSGVMSTHSLTAK